MAKFIITCPDCSVPIIVNTWIFSKTKTKCKCGRVIMATKIANEVCENCGNMVIYDRSRTNMPRCVVCKHTLNIYARNMDAINNHANRSFLTVDISEFNKK